MTTLTANVAQLPEHCPHKLPTSCRLTARPTCCACQDNRPHARTYMKYIDGLGFVPWGNRQERYCWPCKEFWDARVAAAGIPQADTRIPETPVQTRFLERWFDWHRGFRVVRRPDGTEEHERLVGENLADMPPGVLPRTIQEMADDVDAMVVEDSEPASMGLDEAEAELPMEEIPEEDRLFEGEVPLDAPMMDPNSSIAQQLELDQARSEIPIPSEARTGNADPHQLSLSQLTSEPGKQLFHSLNQVAIEVISGCDCNEIPVDEVERIYEDCEKLRSAFFGIQCAMSEAISRRRNTRTLWSQSQPQQLRRSALATFIDDRVSLRDTARSRMASYPPLALVESGNSSPTLTRNTAQAPSNIPLYSHAHLFHPGPSGDHASQTHLAAANMDNGDHATVATAQGDNTTQVDAAEQSAGQARIREEQALVYLEQSNEQHRLLERQYGEAVQYRNQQEYQVQQLRERQLRESRAERIFGTREEVQQDDYQSPIALMFGRAYARLHVQAVARRQQDELRVLQQEALNALENEYTLPEASPEGTISQGTHGSILNVAIPVNRPLPEEDDFPLESWGTAMPAVPYEDFEFTNHQPHHSRSPPSLGGAEQEGMEDRRQLRSDSPVPVDLQTTSTIFGHSVQTRARLAPRPSFQTVPSTHQGHSSNGGPEMLAARDRIGNMRPSGMMSMVGLPNHTAASNARLGLDRGDDGRPDEPCKEEDMVVKMECKICFSQKAVVAVLPCGHCVMCKWCAEEFIPSHPADVTRPTHREHRCPVCRKRVQKKALIYGGDPCEGNKKRKTSGSPANPGTEASNSEPGVAISSA